MRIASSNARRPVRLLFVVGLILFLIVSAAALYYRGASADDERSSWPHVVKVGSNCGLIDQSGRYAVNPQYAAINPPTRHGLYPVAQGDRWGVINASGGTVAEPRFDFAMVLPGDVEADEVHVVENGRWGLVGGNGIVIQPVSAAPLVFDDNGLAMIIRARAGSPVRGEGDIESVGIIDRTGRVRFSSPDWVAAASAGNGVFVVVERGYQRWRLVNDRGEPISANVYEMLAGFDDEGVAAFRQGGKWGFLNVTGEIVIQPRFDQAMPYDVSGLAAVKTDNRWGFINRNGEWAIPAQFQDAQPFGDNELTIVHVGDHRYGIVDRTGRFVLNPQFNQVGSLSGGRLIPVALDMGGANALRPQRWGFVNRSGAIVVEPQYAGFQLPLNEGELVAVKVGSPDGSGSSQNDSVRRARSWSPFSQGQWGFIDASGAMVIPATYEDAMPFDESGLAGVKLNGRWGFIDTNGRTVIRHQFDALHCYREPDPQVLTGG